MKREILNINVNKENYGIFCGAMSYVLWGVLPVYWKIINSVPAYEILAHRILWSFVFVASIVIFKGNLNKITNIFKDKKCMLYISLCSILISLNWFLYIWSVTSGHILEASLGYYINPLMSVLLGTFVLKEKLNRYQYAALMISGTGVLLMIVIYGSFPWIPILLSTSFALYGLFKKMIPADSSLGLAVETLIMAPLALTFIGFMQFSGRGALGTSVTVTVVLVLSGVVTAIPLLLFAEGTKTVKLSTMGFLQYISPTISLIIGVFMFNEHFTKVNIIGFGFIWVALAVYSYSLLKPQNISV
jgi:chloramphenicol-sensitive protein RarD